MSIRDVTPEEQETIQKSKDPMVTMTANGTTHTTEDVTVYVCDLDMFVQVQWLKESPALLSLGKLCEENGCSYAWHPGQPSYFIKNGKNIECRTVKHIRLVVPGVQATEHQTKALEERKRTPAVGDHQRSAETKIPEWLLLVKKNWRGDLQVRQTYLQWTWPYHLQQFLLPRTLQENLFRTNKEESTIRWLIFPKSSNCEDCRRTKVTRAPCRRNLGDPADRSQIAQRFEDMVTADHKVLNEDQ